MSENRWRLWRGQIRGIADLDLQRNFLTRRALWIYLVALAPAAIFEMGGLKHAFSGPESSAHAFALAFQLFFLRFVIFFGCADVFLGLFHGEVVEKSLHFYFLSPVRREILLVGKYLTGLLATSAIFCLSLLLQFVAVYAHSNSGGFGRYLFHYHGWQQLAAYLGVTALACAGYGSVFICLGVLFRNALIPSIVVLIWEIVSASLPPLFQKLSVIYYLKSLCPVEVMTSPSGSSFLSLLVSNPGPARTGVAILAVLLLSAALVTAASARLRHFEIDYDTE